MAASPTSARWEDLVIANGHAARVPPGGASFKQRPVLMRNIELGGDHPFKDVTATAGDFFKTSMLGRGLVVGDLDNDGFPNLVITRISEGVAILRNEAAGKDKSNGWLGVKLVGRRNCDIVGSTVTLEGGPQALTRFAKGGGSYLSASDSRMLFGLGRATQAWRVTVKWSWGETQSWDNLKPGRYWELREGDPVER